MAKQMERLTPHFAHYTSGWLSNDMLTVEQVCEVYAKTQVVPCPMGNINPDSFRIMEALENGSIPVLKRFYGYDIAKYTFGDHPFIVGADWADCARIVGKLVRDPDQYRVRAQAVESWYRRFQGDTRGGCRAYRPHRFHGGLRGIAVRISARGEVGSLAEGRLRLALSREAPAAPPHWPRRRYPVRQ